MRATRHLSLALLVGLLACVGASCSRPSSRSAEREAVTAFIAAMESANRATGVINQGSPYSVMKSDDAKEMIRHYRAALAHADRVDAAILNRKYPGWGDHFDREFRSGIRLVIAGHENVDATSSVAGQKLLNAWGDWLNQNVTAIRNLR